MVSYCVSCYHMRTYGMNLKPLFFYSFSDSNSLIGWLLIKSCSFCTSSLSSISIYFKIYIATQYFFLNTIWFVSLRMFSVAVFLRMTSYPKFSRHVFDKFSNAVIRIVLIVFIWSLLCDIQYSKHSFFLKIDITQAS